MDRNLETLHRRASGHYLKGDLAEAMAAWREVLDFQPDDERARDGIRLCERLPSLVEARPSHAPTERSSTAAIRDPVGAPAIESKSEAGGRPLERVESAARSSPPKADGSAAAPTIESELKRRIDELLGEGQAHLTAGRADDASRTVERILILDEENARARALREAIAGVASPEIPEAAQGSSASAEPAGAAAPDSSADSTAIAADGLASGDEPPVRLQPPPPARRLAWRPSLPTWTRDRRFRLAGAGLILVGAVLGGARMFGTVDEEAAPDPLPRRERVPKQPAQPPPVAPGLPAAANSTQEEIGSLLDQGAAAHAAGDYATAVIAYSKVIERQPDHPAARAGLSVAADLYREQQARQEKWELAVRTFEESDYAEALRLFYRMSPGDYGVDLERVKVNAWYNLGVLAIQTSDCAQADEHFKEALAIQAQDGQLLAALRLAQQCRGPAVQSEILELRFRKLHD